MRPLDWFIVLALAALVCIQQDARGETDPRYCGPPARDEAGKIKRSRAVLAEFKRVHPCPATGEEVGPCPGWAIDHVIPLACGGCDSIINLQWLTDEIKSCAGDKCKDRFERVIYCRTDRPAE